MKQRLTLKDAYQLFHQGSLVMARMEHNGIRVHVGRLNKAIKDTDNKIHDLEGRLKESDFFKDWKREFRHKANIRSGQQLAHMLYKVKGYKCVSFTDKKNPKVDESSLEGIDDPFIKDYVYLSKITKLKSTFLMGIKRELIGEYVHPVFNLHLVKTYRSSCDTPNVQNQHKRNEDFAKLIRRFFIARNNCRVVEVDFKAVEVAIAYVYHKDPTMLRYLTTKGTDMHRDMAMECYQLKEEQVTSPIRYCAKNMYVFPQFYGSYYVDCARHLWEAIERMKLTTKDGIPLKKHLKSKGITKLGKCDPESKPIQGTFEYHIKEVEKRFWGERFPVYAKWKDKWHAAYQKNGSFKHKTGFRQRDLYKKNDVVNHPIQGAAFHCNLWSLVHLQNQIDQDGMDSLLTAQIHDSQISDVPDSEIQVFLNTSVDIATKQLLRNWKWIDVPLNVEVEVSDINGNWWDKEEWVNKDSIWKAKGDS